MDLKTPEVVETGNYLYKRTSVEKHPLVALIMILLRHFSSSGESEESY